MVPSLLAHDIQQGIKQFLITGFEPADGFFHGVMRRFVDNETAWMKGPYLQIGLPFRHDGVGRDFFHGFQTDYPAYTHQREAWQRLASDPWRRIPWSPPALAAAKRNALFIRPWTTAHGRVRLARAASRCWSSTR
jgi:hypothetical protein